MKLSSNKLFILFGVYEAALYMWRANLRGNISYLKVQIAVNEGREKMVYLPFSPPMTIEEGRVKLIELKDRKKLCESFSLIWTIYHLFEAK